MNTHRTMRSRVSLAAIGTLLCMMAASVAFAQVPDPVQPGGPWVTPNQNISLEAFSSYEELTDQLTKIDRQSDAVEVESAGVTGQGRDIWLAKIGDPSKTPVLIITQQHGDEPHGTEAALSIIKKLSTNSAKARQVLDELYVLVVPRVNPDGSTIPERGNLDFSAPERDSRSCFDSAGNVIDSRLDQGRGVFTTDIDLDDGTVGWSYDINRYHWPDWSDSWQIRCNPSLTGVHFDPSQNPVPEAVAVLETYEAYQPIWVVDVHNQGISAVVEDPAGDGANRPNRRVTSSVLWPTNEAVNEQSRDLSKQLALAMKLRSLELGYSEMTRYVGGDFPGIARNAYGLLGNDRIAAGETIAGGSVLVEISGQTEGGPSSNIGQKSIGKLVNEARSILWAALDTTADGSLFDLDPDRAEQLILVNDVDIDNPRIE